jgi:hypothetical protein
MGHQENQNLLEHRRLLKLAREYREKGYSVTVYPSPEKLPAALANYSLGLIAVNGKKVIAAEVRTKENLRLNGSQDIRKISESVQNLSGWEFELVVTNPRKK